jgi:hypothetical protein
MLKDTTRTIKNTETVRNKIRECLELMQEKDSDLQFSELKLNLENELKQEYLKFETIQSLKAFWNKNSDSKLN